MSGPLVIATVMRPAGETGVQTHFRELLQACTTHDQPASLVTPFDAPRWQWLPLFGLRRLIDPLHRPASVWWYREGHRRMLAVALRQHLRDGQPCTVYAQCPVSAHAALQVRRHPRQRVAMVAHFNTSQADEWVGKGALRQGDRLYRAIQAFEADTLMRLDGLVCVSGHTRAALLQRLPALQQIPLHTVPNFIADPGCGPLQPPPPGRTRWLSIGTLEPRKHQAYALELIAHARRQGLEWELTLMGDGPDRPALEQRTAALGLQQAVRFLGHVPDAAHHIADHDALLHTAQAESFGMVLIEAMARGRPVFATPVGGVPEVFGDGIEGRWLPRQDIAAAVAAMHDVVGDPQRWLACAKAARQRYLQHFESGLVVQQLLRQLQPGARRLA